MTVSLRATGGALALALAVPAAAQAQNFRLATLGPGSSPYMVMSTFAQIVNDELSDTQVQVNATGAATQHAIEAAQGNLDFFMWSANVHNYMVDGSGMYANIPNAPELSEELRAVLAFPIGPYHVVTYADADITGLEDLEGKTVFLGPPGGGAASVMSSLIEGATGLVAGEDYEQVQLGWDSAAQAFQDGRIDVYSNATNAPSPVIQQFALTRGIRLLGLTEEHIAKEAVQAVLDRPGGMVWEIGPETYGENQVNEEPVTIRNSMVGIGTAAHVPEEAVYRITKAFWEGFAEMQDSAAWLRNIQIENALSDLSLPLHPGALRYYEEVGMEIPDELRPQS